MAEIQATVPRARMVLASAEVETWRQTYVALLTAAEEALSDKIPRTARVSMLGCTVVVQPPVAAPEPLAEGQ